MWTTSQKTSGYTQKPFDIDAVLDTLCVHPCFAGDMSCQTALQQTSTKFSENDQANCRRYMGYREDCIALLARTMTCDTRTSLWQKFPFRDAVLTQPFSWVGGSGSLSERRLLSAAIETCCVSRSNLKGVPLQKALLLLLFLIHCSKIFLGCIPGLKPYLPIPPADTQQLQRLITAACPLSLQINTLSRLHEGWLIRERQSEGLYHRKRLLGEKSQISQEAGDALQMKEQPAGEEEGVAVQGAEVLETVVEVMERWEGESCRQTPVHYDNWKKKDN